MAKANVSLGGRDILDLDSLSIEEYEMILQTAAEMKKIMKRDIKKVPSLRGNPLSTFFMNQAPEQEPHLSWLENILALT